MLPRTPLSCKHTKRAGVHSISGGMYPLPPFLAIFVVLRGEGGVSPLFGLHACTLCMLVLCEVRGVFRDLLVGVSEIVLQIPLKISTFRGTYPAGGVGAAWFELSCKLCNGRWA